MADATIPNGETADNMESHEDERVTMGRDLSTFLIEPLAVLAGLLANAKEDEISGEVVGNLLGLIVRGARAELKIHEAGGYDALALRHLLGQKVIVEV